MKALVKISVVLLMVFVMAAPALAVDERISDTIADKCGKELSSFCKDVTPGDGRVLACLYAYNDKLSGSCEYGLVDAAAQLERAVAGLAYLSYECNQELAMFCKNVQLGKGRVIKCLDDNKKDLSARCSVAVKDVGSMKK